ncbi:hypothetical protein [Vallitalea maricola]|uniref:Uncharacterized protein n=1 Tax=Vallitalea maricola TaxID=3074433 RepID=A0ACB5UHF9_9FIRM|nr:hypothetical protein AN2V17_11260 [Vallitalea sp. AN17-2]
MTQSTDLWMVFKRNITAILDGPTTSASIFKYPLYNKLVEGCMYENTDT